MSKMTVKMTREEHRLFECCQQLMSIADLAQSDPEQALATVVDLHVPEAATQLRGAVVNMAAGLCKIHDEWGGTPCQG